MGLLQEYRQSLKMREAEELLDLTFYRPIAFGFVKLIHRLPITPNQVTFLSFLCNLAAAYYFALGVPELFPIAAIWFAVGNVLDCSDGQLARIQHSGTPLGRLVDGVLDYVSSVAIFIALGIGLTRWLGDANIWYLVVAGGFASALHAIFFDNYQQEFISNVRGEKNFLNRETEKISAELRTLNEENRSLFRRIILRAYLRYMMVQERSQFKQEVRKQFPPSLYLKECKSLMRGWSFLGSTTNRSLLMIAGFSQDPTVFLWIVLIPGNLWLVVALLWQKRVHRRLESIVTLQPSPGRKESTARV
jgi:hypothetical protein